MAGFAKHVNEIKEWTEKCRMDAGPDTLVYPYSGYINYDMNELKKLMMSACERKMEKARRAATEKDQQTRQEIEKKRRQKALTKINPPDNEAAKFLTKAE